MAVNQLFIDFNAFFASCEQHLRPELRGKPVGVVAVRTDSTCCLAASYEAKRHGVKTGTMVGDARRMCPGMIFVEARPPAYVRLHERLIEVIEEEMHVEAVHSIDEVSCRLTGQWRTVEAARALALQVKAAIHEKMGPWLKCSIGVAPNLFLAKTASDMQKPDGLVVLDEAEWPAALAKLELRDLCGIGPRMEKRLRAAGFGTVAALLAAERGQLRKAWGSVEGARLWEKLHGRDWEAEASKKTVIGHSHVLPPELRNEPKALAVLHRLLQKAAMRLRAGEFFAGTLAVWIDFASERESAEDRHWGVDMAVEPTQDTVELAAALEAVWERERPLAHGARPLRVGVTLMQLEHARDHTPSLFATQAGRREPLLRAVDKVNRTYGHGAVYWAGAHAAGAAAPMRIAFNRIPDRKREQETEWQGIRRKRRA